MREEECGGRQQHRDPHPHFTPLTPHSFLPNTASRPCAVQVSKSVSFEARLAMRSSWLSRSSRDRGAEYQLVATVSHHGRGTGAGHYTADVLQPNGSWLRFDDGNVFQVSQQMVLSDRPYLLFYQRRDKAGGQQQGQGQGQG